MEVGTVKVEDAWLEHERWSAVGVETHAQLDRYRSWNLRLVVAGAVLGALATQVTGVSHALSAGFGGLGAAALVTAGFLQQRLLTPARFDQWRAARDAAESIKALVFRYLAKVAPFAGPDRATELGLRVKAVRGRAKNYEKFMVSAKARGKPVPPVATIADYVAKRAVDQKTWHAEKVRKHQDTASRYRWAELIATWVAAVLAGVGGVVRLRGEPLALWVSVATTVAAAIAAHLASGQHERIAAEYAATVGNLNDLISDFEPASADAAAQARFVDSVEQVIANQNSGWASIIAHT